MAFLNSGQACAAGTRLLVPRSRLDEVKRGIRDAMRVFTVGDPADPKTAVGPMVSQKQYERVESYIRKASKKARRFSLAARAIRKVSKRVTSSSPRYSSM
jgi:acyl-CoA reductase-like NAD-dependent aldehyde dehydrogenase